MQANSTAIDDTVLRELGRIRGIREVLRDAFALGQRNESDRYAAFRAHQYNHGVRCEIKDCPSPEADEWRAVLHREFEEIDDLFNANRNALGH